MRNIYLNHGIYVIIKKFILQIKNIYHNKEIYITNKKYIL